MSELGDEMKKIVKIKDADMRILINEKGSLKDRLQKLEVSSQVYQSYSMFISAGYNLISYAVG